MLTSLIATHAKLLPSAVWAVCFPIALHVVPKALTLLFAIALGLGRLVLLQLLLIGLHLQVEHWAGVGLAFDHQDFVGGVASGLTTSNLLCVPGFVPQCDDLLDVCDFDICGLLLSGEEGRKAVGRQW